MNVDLTAGIVRVLAPAGATAGTGFVVTDDGLIATCAHVVQGTGPGDTVRAAVKDGPRLDLPMPFIPPGFEKLVEHERRATVQTAQVRNWLVAALAERGFVA